MSKLPFPSKVAVRFAEIIICFAITRSKLEVVLRKQAFHNFSIHSCFFFSFSLFAGSRKYNWQKRRNRQTVPGRGKCFLRFLPSTGMTVNPLQTRLQTLLGRRLPGRHVHGPVSSRNVTCSRYGTPRSFETCRVPRRPRRLQCLCLDKLLLKNCSFPNSLRTP